MSSFLRDTVQEKISEGQNDISKDSCRRVYMIRPDEDKKKDPKRSFAKVIELNASSKVQDSQDKSLITPSANISLGLTLTPMVGGLALTPIGGDLTLTPK